MAYLKPVEKPKCYRCDKRATYYVFNQRNANNGAFCTKHANEYRNSLEAGEKNEGMPRRTESEGNGG